jgi:ribosomal protein L15
LPLKIKAKIIVETARKKIEDAGGSCEAESNV